jgi:hypothetical protein
MCILPLHTYSLCAMLYYTSHYCKRIHQSHKHCSHKIQSFMPCVLTYVMTYIIYIYVIITTDTYYVAYQQLLSYSWTSALTTPYNIKVIDTYLWTPFNHHTFVDGIITRSAWSNAFSIEQVDASS